MASTGKEYTLAIKIAGAISPSFGSAMTTASRQVTSLGGMMVKAAAMAAAAWAAAKIGQFAKESIEAANNLESSMADVAKVVDGLRDENGNLTQSYYDMKDSIVEMSKNIPLTAEELASITAAAGTAGIALEELGQFTETAAKMGVAFDVTADQAGDWMAKWRTSFKMTQVEVTTLADQINYLSNNSAATASQISTVVTEVGPLGEVAGISAAQIAALSSTMIGVGVGEDVAGTAIKKLATTMVAGSSATKKQQAVLQQLGIDAKELAVRMQTDAQGAILGFLAAVQRLPEAEQAAALKNYFGQESVGAIAPLLTSLDVLQQRFDMVGDASAYAGSMESEYAARAATTANSIQLLQNKVTALKIQVGEALQPIVNKVIDIASAGIDKVSAALPKIASAVEGAVSAVAKYKDEIIAVAAVWAAFTIGSKINSIVTGFKSAALQVSMFSIGMSGAQVATAATNGTLTLTETIVALLTGQMTLAQLATALWTKAQVTLNAAMAANPIGLIIAAIVAVIAIVILLYKKCEWFRKAVDKTFAAVKKVFTSVGAAFKTMAENAKKRLAVMKENVAKSFSQIKETMSKTMEAAKKTVSEKLQNIKNAYVSHGGGVKGVVAASMETIKGYYTAGYTFINNLTGGKLGEVASHFKTKMSDVAATVSEKIAAIKDWFSTGLSNVKSTVSGALDTVKAYFSDKLTTAYDTVVRILGNIRDKFSSILEAAKEIVRTAIDRIKSFFSFSWSLPSVGTGVLDTARDTVSRIVSSIKSFLSFNWSLPGVGTGVLQSAYNTVSSYVGWIKGLFNWSWSLPHISTPHFYISGYTRVLGVNIPSIGVSWYKNGGILNGAQLFGMMGGKMLGGGEAGPEAVLPLSELWAQMRSMMEDIFNGGDPQPAPADGPPFQITYNPTYQFYGGAPSKTDMVEAARISQDEFNSMMARWAKDKNRKDF